MAYTQTLTVSERPFHGTAGKTFDDMLGHASNRYLADSYRRVERHYHCTVVSFDAGTRLQIVGTASLSYPPDWSIGRSGAVSPPHFSSVDAVLLTERIVARALLETRPSSGVSVTLRHVRLHAGARAGTHLEDVAVECEITAPDAETPPVVTARLGNMRVTATVHLRRSHDGAPAHHPPSSSVTRNPVIVAGEVESSDLGSRWVSRLERISEDGHRIDAVHSLIPTNGMSPATLSVLDLLRLSAQQAQVLIYLRDGRERGSANSLWMRQAHFTIAERRGRADRPVSIQLEIARDRTLARGGVTWRLFDVVATDGDGAEASASLAYLGSSD